MDQSTDMHYMTREFLESQIASFKEALDKKDELIRNLEMRVENLNKSVNANYVKEKNLRDYLMENYESLEMHTEELAEMFDIPLTKEVEFEATVTVTGTVEVELFGGIDLDEFLSENIYVDSAHGDVCISGQSVENVIEI